MLLRKLVLVMKQTLIINYIPPTANERENLARTNKYVSSSSKKLETSKIVTVCNSQSLTQFNDEDYPIKQDLVFNISNSNRDWDNLVASIKYINDGLVKAGVIKNDNLNCILPGIIIFKKVSKGNESIIVTLNSNSNIKD